MANSNAGANGKASRFSADKQPPKRGRSKSVFGPLSKENNLSLDDVRKVYKNILTARFEDLDAIKKKYPSTLTDMTIDLLKQDKLGHLISTKQVIIMNEAGEVLKTKGEREKSYQTTQYMLDRIFGTPNKVDVNMSGNMDIGVTDMTSEENDARIKELMQELGYEQTE